MALAAFLDINGCRIRMHRAGLGAPFLYLHGNDGPTPALSLLDPLAQKFDALIPEHPGFGASNTPEWLTTIHDLAYFYLGFLDALGLKEIHLAGQSLGGWIALEIAVRDPRRLKTLTLVDSAGIHVQGVPKGDFFMRPPDVVLRSLFADQSRADAVLAQKPTREQQEQLLKHRYTIARIAWHPPFFDPELAKWLHRITSPTHIIWGDQDRFFPVEYAKAFNRLIPKSTVTVIPNCGHLPHVEQPRALLDAMIGFVEDKEQ
jgi:pimeloyl-ACP methyl ester carboxylesterase